MRTENGDTSRPIGAGLRLRLWIGCLAAVLVAAASFGVLAARIPAPPPGPLSEFAWVWLPAVLGASILLAVALALWLDRGIVRHLRGLSRGLERGQVIELRGLPSSSGWGELSELTFQAQAVLARQRHMARAGAELEQLSDRQLRLRDALDRWSKGEEWKPLAIEGGALAGVISALNRELPRLAGARGAATRAAGALESGMAAALEEARDVAEQAERGFVESTALLTSVRELDRLAGELAAVAIAPGGAARDDVLAARAAFER
ncbi:MAG: hypothetical protein HYR73_09205, partial [Candidatus Eisenbacteria bacterium]|nr:hypothetical protein [Candidatus Eisenbacteria bacterium]